MDINRTLMITLTQNIKVELISLCRHFFTFTTHTFEHRLLLMKKNVLCPYHTFSLLFTNLHIQSIT